MNRISSFIVVYVLMSGGSSVVSYYGLSQAQVTNLLALMGRSGTFITEKQYQQFIDDHPQSKVSDPVKDQAKIDLNTKSNTDTERIEAIIKYLDLDK